MINVSEVMGIGVAIGRSPEMHAAYKASIAEKHQAHGDDLPCPFCRDIPGGLLDAEIIDEHKGIYIVQNKFAYKIDNGQEVLSHELVVPPSHASDVDDLSPAEARAFTDAMTYLRVNMGRTVMMRSNKDNSKSVPHAHAHGFTYGRRAIFQLYNPAEGTNEILFEGEQDRIPEILARNAFLLSQRQTDNLI